jgi:hypothetical protein
MPLKLFCIVLCFVAFPAHSQTHFTKYRPIDYRNIQMSQGTDLKDTTRLCLLDLTRSAGFKDMRIELREIKDTDSSTILIYRKGKLSQKISIPYPLWHLDPEARVADINGDGRADLKLFIYGTGNGLAAMLSTKVYLFNVGDKFRLVSFFDFAAEKEYDLNGDGKYEILSCNHVYKGEHSYWVYNAYNFTSGNLVNISKLYKYPLWTKHLYKTDRVIAKEIALKDRLKEYRLLPDDILLQ